MAFVGTASATNFTVADTYTGTVDGDSGYVSPLIANGVIYDCISPDKVLYLGTNYSFADQGDLTTSNSLAFTGTSLTQTQISEIATLVAKTDADYSSDASGATLAADAVAIWKIEGASVTGYDSSLNTGISSDITYAENNPYDGTVLVYADPSADTQSLAHTVIAAPEAATWALMLVGAGMMGASLRRRRTAALAQA